MDSFEGNVVSELYVDAEFYPRVMDRLYEMQRSQILCDMNLGADNIVQSRSIHRCVLAANSPAFCALLGEASAPDVTLIVGNSVVVESLIEYMYSGRLRVSLSVARDLLRLGKDYTIGNVACLVEQHLSKSLSLSTWFEIFRIAGEFQLTSIGQNISEFVGANIDKILEGDEVAHLNYDELCRILTASQSTDGLSWKVHVILHWCARDKSERICRVAELLDLVNFKDLDTFSLQVRLMEESAKENHSAFDFAIQDCLSHAENSAVNLNCTKLGTNEEFATGTAAKELQIVSKIDENVVEQFAKVNDDEKKLDHKRGIGEDGNKRFFKCYHHSLKRKSHGKQIIKVTSSLESSKTRAVDISMSEDDPEQRSVESFTAELSGSETDERENPITSKSEVLYFRNVYTGTEGKLKAMPNRALNKKQQQLLSSNVGALSVSQSSNSPTVCGDGRKKLRRVRRKRAKTDEMFVCPLCPKQFPTSSAQRQHTKGHGSETPLLCEVCGFSTRHIASMNAHKQCHFGKRLKCRYDDCSFSAIRSTELEDHHNAHNGIKSHVCVVCGKAFSHRKHHARHEKIHTDPKKFSCSKCNYYSGRSDKMRDHERKHHQPKNGADGMNSMARVEGGNLKRRKRTKE